MFYSCFEIKFIFNNWCNFSIDKEILRSLASVCQLKISTRLSFYARYKINLKTQANESVCVYAFVIVISSIVDATYIRFYKEKRYCERKTGKFAHRKSVCVCLFLITQMLTINSYQNTRKSEIVRKKRSVCDCVKWRYLLRRPISWKQRTSRLIDYWCFFFLSKKSRKIQQKIFFLFFFLCQLNPLNFTFVRTVCSFVKRIQSFNDMQNKCEIWRLSSN